MYKFIIVDDEHIIRKGIIKKIEDVCLDVELVGEAENGKQALELIKTQDPHIILTDMKMPLMDGRTLLQTIQRDYPEKKVIVISGYTDFEYMQEAISTNVVSYILKPFKREAIASAFEKAFLLIEKEQSMLQKVQMAEVKDNTAAVSDDLNTLCSFILKSSNEDVQLTFKSEKFKRLYEIHNFILFCIYSSQVLESTLLSQLPQELDTGLNYEIIPNKQYPNLLFILYYFNASSTQQPVEYFKKEANKIANWIYSSTGNRCKVGISSAVQELKSLHNAFLEAASALNSKKESDTSSVFVFANNASKSNESAWDGTEKLLFLIESGNVEKTMELASQYFDFLVKAPGTTLSDIKLSCYNLFEKVRVILKTHFDSYMSTPFSLSYERNVDYSFDSCDIKSYFLQLLSNISGLLKDKNLYPSDELVSNIKKYVARNYSKNLTLEKVSSMLFVNRSYCSTLFNEKVGQSFTEYINSIRIEKAKDFLKNTDYQIYKIALMLGYENTKYFFRLFKKMTGHTPEEYRQLNK